MDDDAALDLTDAVSLAWSADGFDAIAVQAPWRPRAELDAFARGVADIALLDRSFADLRTGLRRAYPGAFDLEIMRDDRWGRHVVVRFHPPKGEPNPDPYG